MRWQHRTEPKKQQLAAAAIAINQVLTAIGIPIVIAIVVQNHPKITQSNHASQELHHSYQQVQDD